MTTRRKAVNWLLDNQHLWSGYPLSPGHSHMLCLRLKGAAIYADMPGIAHIAKSLPGLVAAARRERVRRLEVELTTVGGEQT